MRLAESTSMPSPGGVIPTWPPILATRGQGGRSATHAHHAMHLVVCARGELRVRIGGGADEERVFGVLTAPDVPHAIDAEGAEVLLVFLDPESDAGASLRRTFEGPVRLLSARERDRLIDGADPAAIMRAGGVEWVRAALDALECASVAALRPVHPRVRRLLRLLSQLSPDADTSLDALATLAGLSPGRLMHVFTESVGIPVRPYMAWLRLQRAAGAISSGRSLSVAAHQAGFADAAHMSRTFRQMLGVAPSALRRHERRRSR